MTKSEKSGRMSTSAAAKLLLERTKKGSAKSEISPAASALVQGYRGGFKVDDKVTSAALKVLRDPKASKAEKTVAASALTQRPASRSASVKSKDVYRAVEQFISGKK